VDLSAAKLCYKRIVGTEPWVKNNNDHFVKVEKAQLEALVSEREVAERTSTRQLSVMERLRGTGLSGLKNDKPLPNMERTFKTYQRSSAEKVYGPETIRTMECS
jgi:hypothetical protein